MSEMENMGDTKFISEIRCPNFTKSAFVSEDVDSDSFSINVANKSMKCNFLHVSCQEIATKSPQNRLEIAASLHRDLESPRKSSQKSPQKLPEKSSV